MFWPDRHRSWVKTGRAYATGTAYISNVRYPARELSALVDQAGRAGDLRRLLAVLNGFYAICYLNGEGELIAAVDRARSIPLFYSSSGNRLFVSDDAGWIKEQTGARSISSEHATELLLTAFVTGPNTLLPEVRQLQLGELLIARRGQAGWQLERDYHYQFCHRYSEDHDLASQEARLSDELDMAVARLIDYAGGRQILLALSGGLDSTMIGLALRRRGYENVRAFTYGSRYSREVLHSSRVAAALGYPWACHQYTARRWRKWLKSQDRREYWSRSHHYATLPHVQDAMAVRGMLESGFASAEAVVVTGQSVEGFYGIQFSPEDWESLTAPGFDPERLADLIYRLHYRLWLGDDLGPGVQRQMCELILGSLGDPAAYGTPTGYFEAWVVREKDAKFNNNSMRAYEHNGLDWWLPLYDSAIIDFWTQLPGSLRHGREFTRRFTANMFTAVTGLEYDYRGGYSTYERAAKAFRPMMWKGGAAAALYLLLKREMKYSRDRMGWHQIVPRQLYRRLFHFRFNINSLLVMELLGALELGGEGGLLENVDIPQQLALRLSELLGE